MKAALAIVAILVVRRAGVLSTQQQRAQSFSQPIDTSEATLKASLNEAIDSLLRIDCGNKLVEKCAKFLITLRNWLDYLGKGALPCYVQHLLNSNKDRRCTRSKRVIHTIQPEREPRYHGSD